jgi:hypothetical protein
MEILRWKIRLSLLWVFMAVGMSAMKIVSFLKPGVLEDIMAGEMEGLRITEGLMAVYFLFWLIPLIMAVLSVTLRDLWNRWTSFVLGIVFVLLLAVDLIGRSMREEPSIVLMLWTIVGMVVAAFIAWFAWRWPKQEA